MNMTPETEGHVELINGFQSSLEMLHAESDSLLRDFFLFSDRLQEVGYDPMQITPIDLISHRMVLMRSIAMVTHLRDYISHVAEISELAKGEFGAVDPEAVAKLLAPVGIVPEALYEGGSDAQT